MYFGGEKRLRISVLIGCTKQKEQRGKATLSEGWIHCCKENDYVKIACGSNARVFEVTSSFNTTPEIFLPYLGDDRPHILHIACHGTRSPSALHLKSDRTGETSLLGYERVADSIRVYQDECRSRGVPGIMLVVLMACETEALAQMLESHVACITFSRCEVHDEACKAFTELLYKRLGDPHFSTDLASALKMANRQVANKLCEMRDTQHRKADEFCEDLCDRNFQIEWRVNPERWQVDPS